MSSYQENNRHASKRRRIRTLVSCTNCHQRKQRCDRKTPCSNCAARRTEIPCQYQLLLSQSSKSRQGYEQVIDFNASPSSSPSSHAKASPDSTQSNRNFSLQGFGFSDQNANTSIGILKSAVESGGLSPPATPIAFPSAGPSPSNSDWYKAYLRELPSSAIIDKLIQGFFSSVKWHYNPVDHLNFMEDKVRWDRVPYAKLTQGIQQLPANTRFFPAVLFQILALALLNWESSDIGFCEGLKYKSDMTLDDIANQYSEAGAALAASLGEDEMSRAGIQAMFLRTMFLKISGQVIESWTMLGETIKGARGLKWHLDCSGKEDVYHVTSVEDMWEAETCRRTWLNLCCWDAHMSSVLGRHMRVKLQDMDTIPPIDAPLIRDRINTAPFPRTELDPPTPLTVLIVSHTIARFLIRISMLDSLQPTNPEIQELHEQIMDFNEHLPSFLWAVDPERSFDSRPDCLWLPNAREATDNTIWFTVLVLHRPHTFRCPKHRTHTVKASLNILRSGSQGAGASTGAVTKCGSFAYLFSTLDAAIIIAVIYILYPKENPRSLENAMQSVMKVITQLESMRSLNTLVDTAFKILRMLHSRLQTATRRKRSVGTFSQSNDWTADSRTPAPWREERPCSRDLQLKQPRETYTEYSLENIPPPLALQDLLCSQLSGAVPINDSYTHESAQILDTDGIDWQLEGNFEDGSLWNLMYQIVQ